MWRAYEVLTRVNPCAYAENIRHEEGRLALNIVPRDTVLGLSATGHGNSAICLHVSHEGQHFMLLLRSAEGSWFLKCAVLCSPEINDRH